jgi:hypothetical protein
MVYFYKSSGPRLPLKTFPCKWPGCDKMCAGVHYVLGWGNKKDGPFCEGHYFQGRKMLKEDKVSPIKD